MIRPGSGHKGSALPELRNRSVRLRSVTKGEQRVQAGILGPLYVRVGPITTVPSAPKLRNILTTLVVHAGQLVPASSLMAELWEDDLPRSGLTTLQTYILALRKLFAHALGRPFHEVSQDLIVTRAGGYVLNAGSIDLDLHRYNALVVAGREALSAGDDSTGIAKLGEALGVWRGPALVDVTGGRVLESRRRQMEESRLIVIEYMIDAQLRLGMFREVLPELVALTSSNPLHEGLHGQYMRALNSSGRRGQALKVFRELRDNLVEELGLEPGAQVQRLHQAILNADDRLEADEQPAPVLNRPSRRLLEEISYVDFPSTLAS
ncbi:AfsR/SARP family transcriptional regulator [Couchioplanes azureus]|nr:AfsR/SARP family transcriptional regulator [Couchioplanes caeruleus]